MLRLGYYFLRPGSFLLRHGFFFFFFFVLDLSCYVLGLSSNVLEPTRNVLDSFCETLHFRSCVLKLSLTCRDIHGCLLDLGCHVFGVSLALARPGYRLSCCRFLLWCLGIYSTSDLPGPLL